MLQRQSLFALMACCLAWSYSDIAVAVELDADNPQEHETMRAFPPKDPEKVQTAVRGIYAVCAVATVGIFVLLVGWARYYAPRYWQRNDPPPQLVRIPKRPGAANEPPPTLNVDRDRFDLEGDLIDYIQDVERFNQQDIQ